MDDVILEIRKHLEINNTAGSGLCMGSKYSAFNIMKIKPLISPGCQTLGICRTTAFAAGYPSDHLQDQPSHIQSSNIGSLGNGKPFNLRSDGLNIRPESFSNLYSYRSVINNYVKNHRDLPLYASLQVNQNPPPDILTKSSLNCGRTGHFPGKPGRTEHITDMCIDYFHKFFHKMSRCMDPVYG